MATLTRAELRLLRGVDRERHAHHERLARAEFLEPDTALAMLERLERDGLVHAIQLRSARMWRITREGSQQLTLTPAPRVRRGPDRGLGQARLEVGS